jgi:hypothetical protein
MPHPSSMGHGHVCSMSAKGCGGHRACVNGRVALSEAYSHTQPRRPRAHELEGFQVRGWRIRKHTTPRESTTTTCYAAARSATLLLAPALDVDANVSRQGASHTCKCQYCACLPCPFLFRTLLLRGTVVGPRLAPLCLSAVCSPISHQACFHSRVCLPSQLCVQRCPAARARTPVWHLPAELGVVAGGARRPACWQAWQAPYLCSNCRLLSELLLQTLFLSPNAGQTMRPRSLPVLVPGNRLEPTPSHPLPTHTFCFAYSRAYFRLSLRFARSLCPVSCVYLTSFVPKHVMAHGTWSLSLSSENGQCKTRNVCSCRIRTQECAPIGDVPH